MNTKNLHQIFKNYIDNFEIMNDSEHNETFKWWAASRFRKLMDEALRTPEDQFTLALDKIRGHKKEDKVVETILESSMQPFTGLIELSKHEPARVQKMLQDLLKDDGNNLIDREAKIKKFFEQCKQLESRHFPNNFRYEQTANSVAGYLFLYDPDNYYMYKATQAKFFSDCVEFYGDWGTGDQINLKEYYRMCNELVAEIQNCPELIKTSDSRITLINRYTPPELASDSHRHILAYDIIYCTSEYKLYDGLTFKPITLKEKKLYQERMKKALEKLEEYTQAENRYSQFEQACNHYNSILIPGTAVQHFKYGQGQIISRKNGNIIVHFTSQAAPIKFDFNKTITNQYLKFTDTLDDETTHQYRKLFENASAITDTLSMRKKNLEEYRDILE